MSAVNNSRFPTSILALSCVATLVFVVSQWIRVEMPHITYEGSIRIIGNLFQIGYAENTGIAFSFPLEGTFLSIVTIVLILLIIGYYWRHARRHPSFLVHTGYGLLLGGAISNGFERLAFGYVVDYFWLRYFSVFNLADAAISLGVLILLIFAYHERNTQSH